MAIPATSTAATGTAAGATTAAGTAAGATSYSASAAFSATATISTTAGAGASTRVAKAATTAAGTSTWLAKAAATAIQPATSTAATSAAPTAAGSTRRRVRRASPKAGRIRNTTTTDETRLSWWSIPSSAAAISRSASATVSGVQSLRRRTTPSYCWGWHGGRRYLRWAGVHLRRTWSGPTGTTTHGRPVQRSQGKMEFSVRRPGCVRESHEGMGRDGQEFDRGECQYCE
mmetsp:Transcript_24171/g.43323  ORF Transcript_24171/g.43323 Transcript_24171/m.43323 type:complete len:230 (+) Transcript_24171:1402-2091(+)